MSLRPRRLFESWTEPERPKIAYAELRGRIHSGDVLRFRSDCLLGHAIEFFRPGGSHAAVCWRTRLPLNSYQFETRVDMAEANERGFVPRRLSTVLAGVKGRVYWHHLPMTLDQEDICTIEIDRMIKSDLAYAYHQLFSLMIHHPKIEYGDDICSEGAIHPAVKAGIIPVINWCPTPGDLVALPGECWEIDLPSVHKYIEDREAA